MNGVTSARASACTVAGRSASRSTGGGSVTAARDSEALKRRSSHRPTPPSAPAAANVAPMNAPERNRNARRPLRGGSAAATAASGAVPSPVASISPATGAAPTVAAGLARTRWASSRAATPASAPPMLGSTTVHDAPPRRDREAQVPTRPNNAMPATPTQSLWRNAITPTTAA